MAGTTFADPILLGSGLSGSHSFTATATKMWLMLEASDLRHYMFDFPTAPPAWRVFVGRYPSDTPGVWQDGRNTQDQQMGHWATGNDPLQVIALSEQGGRIYLRLESLTVGSTWDLTWSSTIAPNEPYIWERAKPLVGGAGSTSYNLLNLSRTQERYFSWTATSDSAFKVFTNEPDAYWEIYSGPDYLTATWLDDGWANSAGGVDDYASIEAVTGTTYHVLVYSYNGAGSYSLTWEADAAGPPYVVGNDTPGSAFALGFTELAPGSRTYDNTGATRTFAPKDIFYTIGSVTEEVRAEFSARPSDWAAGVASGREAWPTVFYWDATAGQWIETGYGHRTRTRTVADTDTRYVSLLLKPGEQYLLSIEFWEEVAGVWESAGQLSWRSARPATNTSPDTSQPLQPGDGQNVTITPTLDGDEEDTYYDITIPIGGGAQFKVIGGTGKVTVDGTTYNLADGQLFTYDAAAGTSFLVQVTASQMASLSWGVSQEVEFWTDWYDADYQSVQRARGVNESVVQDLGRGWPGIGVGYSEERLSASTGFDSRQNTRLYRDPPKVYTDRMSQMENQAVRGVDAVEYSDSDGKLEPDVGDFAVVESHATVTVGQGVGAGWRARLTGLAAYDSVVPSARDSQRVTFSAAIDRRRSVVETAPETAALRHQDDYQPVYEQIFQDFSGDRSPLALELGDRLVGDPNSPYVKGEALRRMKIEWSEPDQHRVDVLIRFRLGAGQWCTAPVTGYDVQGFVPSDFVEYRVHEVDPERAGQGGWLLVSDLRGPSLREFHSFTKDLVWEDAPPLKGDLVSPWTYAQDIFGGQRPQVGNLIYDVAHALIGNFFPASPMIDWGAIAATMQALNGGGRDVTTWPSVTFEGGLERVISPFRFYPERFRVGVYKDATGVPLSPNAGMWADVIGFNGRGGDVTGGVDNLTLGNAGRQPIIFERIPSPPGRKDD